VWFPEPDTSQHAYGVDSPEAQQMYSLADANLGRLLESISDSGEEPDVFVVSDHGYSTIDSVIDVHVELASAGFYPDQGARSVVAAENGGSVLLYLPQKNDQLAIDLVNWLHAQDWVGAIATDFAAVSNHKFASISDIGLDGPRSPDVIVTMRSVETGQSAPLERSGTATGGVIGAGSHGGGSPAELHNTLIASGPSFLSNSSGIRSQIASGNIDVAPTVLELLGIPVPTHMEGRILTEALVGGTAPIVPASTNSSEQSPIVRTATTGEKTYICEFG
jgi:arylsulfatase A-like enzyme